MIKTNYQMNNKKNWQNIKIKFKKMLNNKI